MSEAKHQSTKYPATLELQGEVRLGGELSSGENGKLELSSTRLLRGPAESGSVSLRAGAPATLRIESDHPDWNSQDTVDVTTAGVSGKTVIIELVNESSAVAQRCRRLLDIDQPPTDNHHKMTLVGADKQRTTILEGLAQQSLQQLEQRFRTFIADLRLELMELSLRTGRGGWGQQKHDDASDAVKNNSEQIVTSLVARISSHYHDLTPVRVKSPLDEQTSLDEDSLGLVDINEFEHGLAIKRIAQLGSDLYNLQLECLTLRVAHLIDADPVQLRLPIHIAELCTAFQNTLQGLEIPPEVAPDIYDFFEKQFVRTLDDYYAALNKSLADQAIRPEVEELIRDKGSQLRQPGPIRRLPKRPTPTPAEAVPEQNLDNVDQPFMPQEGGVGGDSPYQSGAAGAGAASTGGAPAHASTAGAEAGSASSGNAPWPANATGTGDTSTSAGGTQSPVAQTAGSPAGPGSAAFADKLYSSLIGALNVQRETQSMTPAGVATPDPLAPPPGTRPEQMADTAMMADALAALQQDAGSRDAVQQSASLRDYLSENRDQISGLQDSAGMAPEAINQLDMVDQLFGTMGAEQNVGTELQPALGNLQIPLARLAMLEPQFILDREHPARGVVDKIARLSTTANFPNKALEGRVQDIVQQIVQDYDQDNSVFSSALGQIDKLMSQQERSLSRNVERVVRTQDGQEKLTRARREVDQAIREQVEASNAPSALMRLIETGWRDLLVLTHVREGPDSEAWQKQLGDLNTLDQWLRQQHQGEVSEEELPARKTEANKLIDTVGQQLSTTLPTNIAYQEVLEELRDTLAGLNPVEIEDLAEVADEDQTAVQRAKINDLPRLRRWIKRVEQLESGNWLSYRDRKGDSRRMQLAWVSADKDRFIFVNERGQKNADLSAIQLARQLSQGVQAPAPAEELGLIDRSVYDTLEQLQKTLSFTRNHDSLTNLINRDTFLEQMGRALSHSRNKNSEHAVLYLDIDQFNLVNDLYDRVNGDQVLLEFGKLLAQLHGKKSSSARIDQDEFALLLLDRNPEQALEFAEKVRADIEASSVAIEGEKVTFTVSIGVAPMAQHSPAVETILESARAAMYLAKDQGRNCVVPFAEDQARARNFRKEQARTRQDLEQALETDRFALRAQPIVQTTIDGDAVVIRRYELLLGWRDKDGSLTSPEQFIRSAERYGFMTLVDRWVVREAFSWISKLMDEQKVVPHLAINLSGSSITNDSFMEYLLEQISEFGVGTSRICFEITEAGTISNVVKAADFVSAFRNIGCKFSLDDFGTGLASHDFLRELPVDYVKIDGTFIKEIDTNRNDYAMTRSINDLAHFLGQETIAESVENEEIINSLREIGVDYLQGWGVAKPRLLEDITKELSSIEK